MSEAAREWRRLGVIAGLLITFAFCLYLPTLFHNLFADDEIYLAFSNRLLRYGTWSDLTLLLQKPANPWEFLPLRDFTYWLDFHIYGDEPAGFHLTNLLWYALAAAAAGWLFFELLSLRKHAPAQHPLVLAVCGVLLFVVHPAHVEAVAWVAARKDLIAGALCMLSAACLANGIRHGWRLRETLLCALFLFGACFGKGAATVFVLFLGVLGSAGWRVVPVATTRRKVFTLVLLAAVVFVATYIHMKTGVETGIRIVNDPGLLLMIERASRILAALNLLLLVPVDLGLYHDVYALGEWHWLASAGILLVVLLALRAAFRERAVWGFGVVLAEVPLLVYLQFVPFTTWSLASERFLFVSVAGLALVLLDLLERLAQPRRMVLALLLVTLPAATLVWNRVADWEYGEFLFAREYERQPHFHNAIRDRIIYGLLPEKRYVEARELARTLDRDYASASLLALIDTEEAYRRLRAASVPESHSEESATVTDDERQAFCSAAMSLRRSLAVGYGRIPGEADVSYNNLLRSQERQLSVTYSERQRLCS